MLWGRVDGLYLDRTYAFRPGEYLIIYVAVASAVVLPA